VLLEKFWNYVDFYRLTMPGVNREKHRFDKCWLLDVLSTYVPNDEIFLKSYMPTWVVQGLPESIRKTKRKGLRLAKDCLRAQRLERIKAQKKRFTELEAEERDRGKEESKKSKGKFLKSTNESSFKSPLKST
jgi:hypothetical protein